MHGLALVCAFVFWGGLAFWGRWTIQLHVRANYQGTEKNRETSQNGTPWQNLGTIRVNLQGYKTDVDFSFSAASFHGLFEDVQKIIADRILSKTETPTETLRNKNTNTHKDTQTSAAPSGEKDLGLASRATHIVRALSVGWAKLCTLLALRCKIKSLLHPLTRKMEVQVLRVAIREGTGDAALTALLYGALWMVWGNLVAHLHRRIRVTGQDIGLSVEPDFSCTRLNLDIMSIVRLKTSHIIVKSFQLVLWIRRTLRKKN